jgi:hypothetical protein
MDNYLDSMERYTQGLNAHRRHYPDIEPEQSFMENVFGGMMLDTFTGQLANQMYFRWENDAELIPNLADLETTGYNPFVDSDLMGYPQDEFLKSTSEEETQAIKDLYDHNMAIRGDLQNHGWARFMGNILDPINLIPIPIARGMGFVQGMKSGGLAVGGVMAGAESARAEIDPTNPWWEPPLAIAGGAIFGAAIGGGVGAMRSADEIAEAGSRYIDFWNMQDAKKRIADRGEIEIENIKPYVEPLPGENKFAHVQKLIEKPSHQTRAEHHDMIVDIVREHPEKYEDVVAVSRLHNPDEFASTFTGIERQRFEQHPFFMLKNTLFTGGFGSNWRRLADRIAGTPGMHTKESIAGKGAIDQGVVNKAQIHNKYVREARDSLYHAYRRSQGMKLKDDLTPGQQVWESAWDVATLKYKALPDGERRVNRAYLEWDYTGTKSLDPNVNAGVEALAKYWDTMGEMGVEAGVFGVIRLQKDLVNIATNIGKTQEFLLKYLEGDPTAQNKAFRLGARGTLKKDQERLINKQIKIASLDQKEQRFGGLTKGEKKLKEDIQSEIPELELKIRDKSSAVSQTEVYLRNPDTFFANVNKADSGFMPEHGFTGAATKELSQVLSKHRETARINDLLYEWGAKDPKTGKINPDAKLPNADVWSRAHLPRMWHKDVVFQNREELTQILTNWYTRNRFSPEQISAAKLRGEETVATILKEKELWKVKRILDDAIKESGIKVSPVEMAKINKRLDDLWDVKISKTNTRVQRAANLSKLVKEISEEIPFDDPIKATVFKDLEAIEDMAAVGQPEGFGASVSTMERRLDIPSALLIKGDGTGPSKASVNFIETNPELLMQNYHRRMSVSIEMAEEFGDPTMFAHLEDLRVELKLREERAGTKAERKAIREEGVKMLQAVNDLKEKALGVYRIPQDPSSLGNRTVRSLKNWMVLALMGKASIAALADIGRGAMSVGLAQTFELGFRRFGAASRDFKLAAIEVGEAGEAAEMALHGRFQSMFDLEGYSMGSNAGMFEKFFQGGVNKMFVINMLAPYTDVMKRFYGGMIQSNMIKASLDWTGTVRAVERESIKGRKEIVFEGRRGSVDDSDMQALTKNGIDFEDAVAIAEQFRKHGEKGDFLFLANTRAWDNIRIQKKFRTALVGEVNNAVITPGIAEKLNFMSTPVGGLMTQFKSFALSATHRTMLAGLQQRDARAFHGVLSMIAMGYMVDMIKSPTYDKRDLLSLDRFVQAVDYSGATGVLFDLNNMLEFLTASDDQSFHMGIRPWLGVESFWKDPNLAQRTGQLGGPTASLFGDLLYSTFYSDKSSDAVRSIRRLIPFNNVIWWTFIIDRLQRSISTSVDKKVEE